MFSYTRGLIRTSPDWTQRSGGDRLSPLSKQNPAAASSPASFRRGDVVYSELTSEPLRVRSILGRNARVMLFGELTDIPLSQLRKTPPPTHADPKQRSVTPTSATHLSTQSATSSPSDAQKQQQIAIDSELAYQLQAEENRLGRRPFPTAHPRIHSRNALQGHVSQSTNACFLAATVSALRFFPNINAWLAIQPTDSPAMKKFKNSLSTILQDLRNGRDISSARISELRKALSGIQPTMSLYGQESSDEVLTALFGNMTTPVDPIKISWQVSHKTHSGEKQNEPRIDTQAPTLSLAVAQSTQTALTQFFAPERLKDYKVDGQVVPAELRAKIIGTPPQSLVLNFKRYRYMGSFQKSHSQMEVNPTIQVPINGTNVSYQLNAIIVHHGGFGGGHYISYTMNTAGEWFRCDSLGGNIKVNFSEVKRDAGTDGTVFLYERA